MGGVARRRVGLRLGRRVAAGLRIRRAPLLLPAAVLRARARHARRALPRARAPAPTRARDCHRARALYA